MLEYLNSLVDAKLTDNEKNIYFARIGITQEESTLEKIGEQEGVTKERIRQILVICKQKLTDLLKLDQETKTLREMKHKLLTNIKKVSYSGFAIYLACKEQINLLKDFFIEVLMEQKWTKVRVRQIKYEIFLEQSKIKFNKRFKSLIIWPSTKKKIKKEEWDKIHEEREVDQQEESYSGNFNYGDKSYEFESKEEKIVLRKLLWNKTFKEVKAQSLKIFRKIGYYYPDIQCLTHDNHLVVIEVKPIFRMCEQRNIKKFNILKEYCEKNGYGYVITDSKFRTYDKITSKNKKFEKEILNNLPFRGEKGIAKFKEITAKTGGKTVDLLYIIKKHDLKFSFPFTITK